MSELASQPQLANPRKFNWRILLRRTLDGLTFGASLAGALMMILLLGILLVVIIFAAWPAIQAFGLRFFISTEWDPVKELYGGWLVVYGTLVTSAIALLIAVPVSLGSAVFLVRLAPKCLAIPSSFLIELLAAIPSIAFGIWGYDQLGPLLQDYVQPVLAHTLGKLPTVGFLFEDSMNGFTLLTAGVVLAIMIIPIITAITRDVLRTVPPELEQGAIGLGATWWQATKIVISYSKMGIFGAIILGLARAIGETMAVTLVIGGTPSATNPLRWSILSQGGTIASQLASKYREADTDLFSSSLLYCALLLLLITMLINGLSRLMISRVINRADKK